MKNNPKNRVKIMTSWVTDDYVNEFKRIYISYYALKERLKQICRPILGLDRCFLKSSIIDNY